MRPHKCTNTASTLLLAGAWGEVLVCSVAFSKMRISSGFYYVLCGLQIASRTYRDRLHLSRCKSAFNRVTNIYHQG